VAAARRRIGPGSTALGAHLATRLHRGHAVSGIVRSHRRRLRRGLLRLHVVGSFGSKLLNPKVGKRYRDTIFAQGGQRHFAQLVKDFLGRETNSEAFFAEITGRR
jgi:thimet oligopeptidase